MSDHSNNYSLVNKRRETTGSFALPVQLDNTKQLSSTYIRAFQIILYTLMVKKINNTYIRNISETCRPITSFEHLNIILTSLVSVRCL